MKTPQEQAEEMADKILDEWAKDNIPMRQILNREIPLPELIAVAQVANNWIKEHNPSCEESFYQVDSINANLPELGIAIFHALQALRATGKVEL